MSAHLYRLTAFVAVFWSATVMAAIPPAPTNLDASTTATSIKLRWTDPSPDETQFKVERKTGIGGTYAQIGTTGANVPNYTDTTAVVGNIYFYQVRGSNSQGDGPYSNEAGVFFTTTSNDTGYTLDLYYDPFGNHYRSHAGGINTTATFDLRGRKTSMTDPDMGVWNYSYNAFGEQVSQTDAKSQTSTMTYDTLGRMTNRTEPDLISTWTYDTCPLGVGKLCQVSSDNGYTRTYSYDTVGRVSQVAVAFAATTYAVGYTYDASGRPSQTTYPTGFVAKNVYNAFGYLQQLTDVSGMIVYWQANTVSASGNILNETLGNTLTTTRGFDIVDRLTSNVVSGTGGAVQNFTYAYDDVDNVTQRVDALQAVTENFNYDKLNRVDLSSGPGLVTKTYSYDAHGNILSRSDVGSYTYGAKPHAVASVAGTLNASYAYDANGNMTSGNGRTMTYTSYNMPATITTSSYTYTYTYSPDHERVRLVHSTLGTFVYVHPAGKGQLLYEQETKLSGLVENKHYLNAGPKLVGVHITRSDATQETKYFHHDNVGSISVVTNSSGAVLERLAYEAFGKRRFLNGADDPGNTIMGVNTDRGFTAHEHLDEIGLIHMNGRIYDPQIGRFLTADPHINDMLELQSYNRFSYVNNNPLAHADPTGFIAIVSNGARSLPASASNIRALGGVASPGRSSSCDALCKIGRGVKNVVNTGVRIIENAARHPLETAVIVAATYFTGGLAVDAYSAAFLGGAEAGAMTSSVVGGAAGGFAGSYVGSGGDLKAGLRGAVAGGILGGVDAGFARAPAIARVTAKAAASGVASKVQGGTFKDGVKAFAATSAARYAYHSMVGQDVNPAPGKNRPARTNYQADKVTGKLSPADADLNVWGINEHYKGNGTFKDAFRQGSPLSQIANRFGGQNALARADDNLNNRLGLDSDYLINKVVTIPMAAGLTVPALYNRLNIVPPRTRR